MTTITPKPGNQSATGPAAGTSLRDGATAPGTLTAVSHADQPRTTRKDAPAAPPGAPRPVSVRPTPLPELAALVDLEAAGEPTGPRITGITHDSRAVRPGDLYAALPGAKAHGADFAAQAAALGAAAVLTDPAGAERAAATGLPVLAVADPRARMGELAAAIYGRPGEALLQLGITGTSGKTTTAYLVEGGLRAAGWATGLVGTVEMRIGDERIKSERTTPEATDLQALFAVMRERGVEAVAMEVSSHALVLGRVDGCVFDVAVFNNLSPEHMEFHSDMEDYFQAKAQLFTERRARLGVVNADDEYGRRLAKEATIPIVTFSATGDPAADWRAEDVVLGAADSTLTLVGPDGQRVRATAPLPGPFNVANTVAAIVTLAAAGIDPQTAADGVAAVPGVPGRLERVDAGQPFLAVVDYAHKTDAVESVLRALREVTEGRLHIVLGCGGDRDTTKRAPMGAAAARFADVAVLTSDNPRSEDPLAILAAMFEGAVSVPPAERGAVLVDADRAAAIAAAVASARPGDTVLVAGKGHEQGQDTAGVVRPFDDREVLRAAIEARTEAPHHATTQAEVNQ
ncbi:UDP-N-acetylmuramoyl-L-alanyl-D-glutamate--2,6-diaminopimelate ligase [Streptomyces sp. NBC_00513]|uniref:UDP-N-acetylmuramoyl-L-alanyl-D-glutamate--2, 6-diaminopimelate ligase n=1 Tax=unclassified Streptomyces TaxID=2593676 RepID=UPI0022536C20|nr:UDP-N-acetylmuramoyl-L-alanyl-D-glutamate--2,6-diaminopimelate ligase [Streptomyces sp. NBC_00424]MCX5075868.1 UDP-N-acetylmuramoyl-L-alanyl-D-glutamate--2,6-diaminopimelate ligase [Streptomyces sp. NBC_00424]WUD41057.1 UDP-N-acetylmuramoyl-L-alanyl-D-glutamate--2,6-diaminopimelate ligase [Streptomyces sp. NBC_00513]